MTCCPRKVTVANIACYVCMYVWMYNATMHNHTCLYVATVAISIVFRTCLLLPKINYFIYSCDCSHRICLAMLHEWVQKKSIKKCKMLLLLQAVFSTVWQQHENAQAHMLCLSKCSSGLKRLTRRFDSLDFVFVVLVISGSAGKRKCRKLSKQSTLPFFKCWFTNNIYLGFAAG